MVVKKPKYKPKSPDHRGWDREGRTEALVLAAIEVFGEHGFDASTTREIADRAGCSEGLISRYFTNKQGLLLAAVQRNAFASQGMALDTLPPDMTLEDELRWVFATGIDDMWRARDFMRVAVGRSIVDEDFAKNLSAKLDGLGMDKLYQRLAWHKTQGRVAASQNLEEAVEIIRSMMMAIGFHKQIVSRVDRAKIKAAAASCAGVLARGLAHADAGGASP